MTGEQFRKRIKEMTKEEFIEFHIGTFSDISYEDRSRVVSEFARRPELERLLCYNLGEITESEKIARATTHTAQAARISAIGAMVAAAIALAAILLG